MDDLRREVNEAFEKGQADLGDLNGARERMIRSALAARPDARGTRIQLAASIAAILIAAAVIATFAYVRMGNQPTHGGPIGTPGNTPHLPAGFVAIGADPLSASTGWLLLTNCKQPVTDCPYYVTHTADGGRTWSKAVEVGHQFDPSNDNAPSSIHFINALDGFVVGGVAAMVTHNGGRTWSPVDLHPTFFVSVTGEGTNAWAVTYPCAKDLVCPFEVQSSVDAGRTWSAPFSLPVSFLPDTVQTIGSSGLLLSSQPTGDLEITLDSGASWRLFKTACPGHVYRGIVASADGNELWELCLQYPNGETSNESLFVSEDGGKSWALRTSSQVNIQQVTDDYSTSLVSVRAGTAVMLGVRSPIRISHDGGRTWTQVSPNGVLFASIWFANATDGWAIDVNKSIWITTDGGSNWTQGGA